MPVSPSSSEVPAGRSALLTDLYELTMAYGYWNCGTAEREAVFQLSFRTPPFGSGFTIAAGLEAAIDYARGFRFGDDDLRYLESLRGRDGRPLFKPEFLRYLQGLRIACDIDAIPEGTIVFPHEPLLRVCGPILQGQLLETALLNFVNFQSLIATKAARICLAAGSDPVIEFGLRRAQGVDGGMSATRAAFIGGVKGTSNVLAGKRYGIPVMGTHAHSWVMAFDSEPEAFGAYAKALPSECIFLVDTYDSLEGVRNAVRAGKELRARGYELGGIRLDSGDLAYLSLEARKILDAGGFPEAAIVASNDLDEQIIASLKQQGAAINVWGVGTRLVTAYDQPALGCVYKLSAIRRSDGAWEPRMKLSDNIAKTTNPGILQVRRFRSATEFLGDAIYDVCERIPSAMTIVDPADSIRRKHFDQKTEHEDLLVPIFRRGESVYQPPSLVEIQMRSRAQIASLHQGIKRLVNPHQYPAGLELGLHGAKTSRILRVRDENKESGAP